MIATSSWLPAAEMNASPFDATALLAWLDIVGDPTPMIRRGLPMIDPPAWDADALAALFGFDNANHCFHVAPHQWARFHEPQITVGFAHFLNSGTTAMRLSRVVAFAKAAALCAGRDPAAIDAFCATSARCVAEENRTDILVELRHGGQRIGVSVEAKFGHRLTAGQLPKALKHARDVCGWAMDHAILLVVAPDPDVLQASVLRQNRRFGWHVASWWSLLTQLERVMAPDFDCHDYRRFRRTVWHRAY